MITLSSCPRGSQPAQLSSNWSLSSKGRAHELPSILGGILSFPFAPGTPTPPALQEELLRAPKGPRLFLSQQQTHVNTTWVFRKHCLHIPSEALDPVPLRRGQSSPIPPAWSLPWLNRNMASHSIKQLKIYLGCMFKSPFRNGTQPKPPHRPNAKSLGGGWKTLRLPYHDFWRKMIHFESYPLHLPAHSCEPPSDALHKPAEQSNIL